MHYVAFRFSRYVRLRAGASRQWKCLLARLPITFFIRPARRQCRDMWTALAAFTTQLVRALIGTCAAAWPSLSFLALRTSKLLFLAPHTGLSYRFDIAARRAWQYMVCWASAMREREGLQREATSFISWVADYRSGLMYRLIIISRKRRRDARKPLGEELTYALSASLLMQASGRSARAVSRLLHYIATTITFSLNSQMWWWEPATPAVRDGARRHGQGRQEFTVYFYAWLLRLYRRVARLSREDSRGSRSAQTARAGGADVI